MNDDSADPGMVKEEIIKPDGRYLIYYTWPDAAPDKEHDGDGPSASAVQP